MYEIRQSAFHTAYTISRHRTLTAAIRRLKREQRAHGDCTCGGPAIVPADAAGPEDGAPYWAHVSSRLRHEPTADMLTIQAEVERALADGRL